MDVSGVLQTHPFIDARILDQPKPALGANAGSAYVRPSTTTTGTAFVSPMAVPAPRNEGRIVDMKL